MNDSLSTPAPCLPNEPYEKTSMPNSETFSFADEPTPKIKQPQKDPAQRLLDWLMQHWHKNTISRRDISNHGPRPIRDRQTAIDAAETLERAGWLVPAPTHRHDRRVWKIVP